jgi:hypothetical protein
MSNQNYVDPFSSADNADERQFTNEYWGEVIADAFYCVLEKGIGKVLFDEKVHPLDRRLTAVKLEVMPLAEMNLKFNLLRDVIAEFKDWTAVTLPSIKRLGISLRELNGKFVKCKLSPTGETYVSKDGAEKDRTAIEFMQVFNNQAECEADFAANGRPAKQAMPGLTSQPQTVPTNGGNGKDPNKETALKFLRSVVTQAAANGADLNSVQAKVAESIANMPLINKHFTIDSPETMALIAESVGA